MFRSMLLQHSGLLGVAGTQRLVTVRLWEYIKRCSSCTSVATTVLKELQPFLFFFLFFLVLQDQQHWHCGESKNDVYVHSILCLMSLNA